MEDVSVEDLRLALDQNAFRRRGAEERSTLGTMELRRWAHPFPRTGCNLCCGVECGGDAET